MTLWLVQPSFCKAGFLFLSHLSELVLHPLWVPSLHLGFWHLLLNMWIPRFVDLCQISLERWGLCRHYNHCLLHLCLKRPVRFTQTLIHMQAVLSSWRHLPILYSLSRVPSCPPKARSIISLQFDFRSPQVSMDSWFFLSLIWFSSILQYNRYHISHKQAFTKIRISICWILAKYWTLCFQVLF